MKYFFIIFLLVFASPAMAEEDACTSIDTEFEMYDCLSSHYEEIEQLMMKTYQQALFQISEEGDEKKEKLFVDSQQNWVAFRETACLSETYDIEDEKQQPLMLRLCYMRHSERRTEDIQEFYKTWEKGNKPK